jgi:hypothetical protein
MKSFQLVCFYLIIMANWSSNFVLSAPVNSQDFDFHLKEPVFDYTVTESPKLNPVSLFYDFKLNLDVMGRVFEFLFSPEDDENFIQIASSIKIVSKSFYSAVQFYMENFLRTIKCVEKSDPSVLSALCLVFGGKAFKTAFSGLKNRSIDLKDLIEIGHSFNYKSFNPQIRCSLKYLSSLIHHPNPFDHTGIAWINRAVDRVFLINHLPYSAEMYLLAGVFDQVKFFGGICEIKDDPQILDMFFNRFITISHSQLTSLQMIQISVEKGNVRVLEKLLEILPADIFESPSNDFLEILINQNLFSLRLLQLTIENNNKLSIDGALRACLNRKNYEIFEIILDHYVFNDLKWLGCKYLLSRKGVDHHLRYDHHYFIDNFFKSQVDTLIFPLLMPIFDLGQAHFKQIFKILIELEEFDFSEPQNIENSLIFHCISSTEDYLELLPEDASHFLFGNNGKISHIRDVTEIQPNQIKLLLSRSRSPLDLLYFASKFDDIKVVSELLPLFDINGIINVTLDEIVLTPTIVPNIFLVLKSAESWTLLQLAIIFKRLALIELIFKDKRFDPNQLKFKVANRWTASQLITQITRFQSESPYFNHSAHELEQISELFK